MAVVGNEYVQRLPDLEFFQGDTVTIPFRFFDGDNNPIDLRQVDIFWYCTPYGRYKAPALILSSDEFGSDGVAKITVSEVTPNICYVNLDYEETKLLNYVKYSHQPVLSLRNSRGTRRYIRAEGDIIFRPYIRDFVTV